MFPFFIPYPWQENELISYSNTTENKNEERFGGVLLPFLGGVLIGGLFVPKPTYFYNKPMPLPYYSNQPMLYYPPQNYIYTETTKV